MVYIYALVSEDTTWYVGSTTDCKRRLKEHKRNGKGCRSKLIPNGVSWKLIILDDVNINDRYTAEKFYIDYLEPKLNKNMPTRTPAQWYQENFEIIKERREAFMAMREARGES